MTYFNVNNSFCDRDVEICAMPGNDVFAIKDSIGILLRPHLLSGIVVKNHSLPFIRDDVPVFYSVHVIHLICSHYYKEWHSRVWKRPNFCPIVWPDKTELALIPPLSPSEIHLLDNRRVERLGLLGSVCRKIAYISSFAFGQI